MDRIRETLKSIEDTLADIDNRLRRVETFIAEMKGRKTMLTSIQDVLIFVCVIVAACASCPSSVLVVAFYFSFNHRTIWCSCLVCVA